MKMMNLNIGTINFYGINLEIFLFVFYKMNERLIKIVESRRKGKKYTATVRTKEGKERLIHFGAIDYEQFKDSTPVGAFSHKDHGDMRRRENYFSRHSGVKNKTKALKKEIAKSKGKYNAKILSHRYLW